MAASPSPNGWTSARQAAAQAIERGDRSAALGLLGALARGQLEADDVDPVTAEALVATARAEHEERDREALERYHRMEAAAERIVQLLQTTVWDRGALARIRALVDQLDHALAQQEQEQARPSAAPGLIQHRALGRGSLEAKLIRGYGPYLYYRFWEAGRHRSIYVGKVGSVASD